MAGITGSAYDLDGNFRRYALDYRALSSGTWTPIAFGATPVSNGTLGTWNTTGLADGHYLLRLTVEDWCGKINTAVRIVRVDTGPDQTVIRSPATDNVVLGGCVCPDGTVADSVCATTFTVAVRAVGGAYQTVATGTSVVNDSFTSWNTIGYPDGAYDIRVTGTTACGSRQDTRRVIVDNTPPTVQILTPLPCNGVLGQVPVTGTVTDAHLGSWALYFAGGPYRNWQYIAGGSQPVSNGLLGTWNTTGLPDCAYALRLVAYDTAGINCTIDVDFAETIVTVPLSFSTPDCGDCDGDGDVDLLDFAHFQQYFGGPF